MNSWNAWLPDEVVIKGVVAVDRIRGAVVNRVNRVEGGTAVLRTKRGSSRRYTYVDNGEFWGVRTFSDDILFINNKHRKEENGI